MRRQRKIYAQIDRQTKQRLGRLTNRDRKQYEMPEVGKHEERKRDYKRDN